MPAREATQENSGMTTRGLAVMATALEVTAGAALIACPSVFVLLLLGATISGSGIAVARVGGFGLLSLGLACWPIGKVLTAPAASALLTYNALAALYFGYLRVDGGFTGYLLWPACAIHASMALLLAYPAYQAVRREWPGVRLPVVATQVVSETGSGSPENAKTKAG
jgi:hypothetical protein